MSVTTNEGWTVKSVVMATAVSLALMLVVVRLAELGIGLGLGWASLFLPALGGAIFLGLRHRRTWLLSLLVFLPLMMFLLVLVVVSMGIAEGNDL